MKNKKPENPKAGRTLTEREPEEQITKKKKSAYQESKEPPKKTT